MVASYPEADVGKEWKVGRWLVRKDVAKQVFGGATKSGWFWNIRIKHLRHTHIERFVEVCSIEKNLQKRNHFRET